MGIYIGIKAESAQKLLNEGLASVASLVMYTEDRFRSATPEEYAQNGEQFINLGKAFMTGLQIGRRGYIMGAVIMDCESEGTATQTIDHFGYNGSQGAFEICRQLMEICKEFKIDPATLEIFFDHDVCWNANGWIENPGTDCKTWFK